MQKEDLISKAKQLLSEGLTHAEIAERLNRSLSSIYKYLRGETPLRELRKQKAIELLEKGLTRQEIARELKINLKTACIYLSGQKKNYSRRRRAVNPAFHNPTSLLEELRSGRSQASLAEEHGVSEETIRYHLKRLPGYEDALREGKAKRTKPKSTKPKGVEKAKIHHRQLLQWWEEGKTLNEMAALRGVKFGTMTALVIRLRRRWGFFPKRYLDTVARKADAGAGRVVIE